MGAENDSAPFACVDAPVSLLIVGISREYLFYGKKRSLPEKWHALNLT
jgi:hypothetical protein